MPCSEQEVQIQRLLNRLESALKTAEQWSSTSPSSWAMESEAPFACDRMSFAQWLQFIFIPKMNDILKTQNPLPTRMALLPMAEEWNKGRQKSAPERRQVLEVIAQIDSLFSGKFI
ncbi:YqcC family protein [Paraglaciecola polaris]|nr:YqcC family protein [Paraglaciecola polaris]